MNLKDTTKLANEQEEIYLLHAQSEHDRYGVAIEQTRSDRFQVSVLFKEPAWDLFGVVRYWIYDDRSLAEARYLELQGLLEKSDEQIDLNTLLAALPKPERHWAKDGEKEDVM